MTNINPINHCNQCITVLNALTADKKKLRRLIILVDEIDRCLPNEQLIVLERLHHLFAVKNCAVIVALNKKAIYSTFDSQFGGDGIEYLRKFFTYNFTVETEHTTFLRNLIKDFIDEINRLNSKNYVYTKQETEPLIAALLNEFSKASLKLYSNRDIENYFKKFYKVWEKDKTLNISYIAFLLFMVLYKQYNQVHFRAYQEGKQYDNELEVFDFGGNIQINSSHPFHYGQITLNYLNYNNTFCNQFTSLMNSIRFRNNSGMFNWFQALNRMNFYHLHVPDEKNKNTIDQYFDLIENYGTMTKGNSNEKQRN